MNERESSVQATDRQNPDSHDVPCADTSARPTVIGIGASAGGLEPLEVFFQGLAPDTGAAFVVIQHLSPDFRSLMNELLARHTTMPITVVNEDTPVEANHVYLIAPRTALRLESGVLKVEPREEKNLPEGPIDIFFESLAAEQGETSVAVVLSGTGTDGTRGVVAVKDRDGVVLVQEPSTASFDGMPQSALQTVAVDATLGPGELSERLTQYLRTGDREGFRAATTAWNRSLGPVDEILDVLRGAFGVDFRLYKPNMLLRRIERRMTACRTDDYGEYVRILRDSEREQQLLYEDLLIRVTEFFRDREALDALAREVVPRLVAEHVEKGIVDEEIRVWVPGCATGEEAITIAILLEEHRRANENTFEFKVFATDIDPETVRRASMTHFPTAAVAGLDPQLLARYFDSTGSGVQLRSSLRERIVFAQQDLVRDPPFTRIDLVSCRNVLIYFRADLQARVLASLDFALKSDGWLFLGPSETVGEFANRYRAVDTRWKIYRKHADAPRRPGPHVLSRMPSASQPSPPPASPRRDAPAASAERMDYAAVATALAEDLLRVCVLLDAELNVRYVLGDPSGILQIPLGITDYDITRMLDGDLRLAVGTALHHTRKTREDSVCRNVPARGDTLVDVRIKSLEARSNGPGRYLVLFRDASARVDPDADEELFEIDEQAGERIEQLEHELGSAKAHLQATIEELETTNEELQAANEELLAGNEELQSTNEELHSVNEELYTVNAEHQTKIRELTVLNADIENLFQNLDIGVVFLDAELRVRKFTTRATEIVKMIPTDVGRPLEHLNQGITGIDLVATTRRVLEEGRSYEHRVQSPAGAWLLLKILPYRDAYGETQGAVLTLVDISEIIRAETDSQRQQAEFRQFAAHIDEVFWLTDATGEELVYVNDKYERFWGKPADLERGRDPLFDAIHPDDRERIERALEENAWGTTDLQYRVVREDGSERWLENRAFRVTDDEGEVIRVAGIVADVTQRRRAEQRVRQLAAIVQSSRDGMFSFGVDGVIRTWNPGSGYIFGPDEDEAIGRHVADVCRGVAAETVERIIDEIVDGADITTVQFETSDGGAEIRTVELTVSPIDHDGSDVTVLAGIARDVSDRLARETELRELTQNLERQANHDPLTGLLNRRGLEKFLFVELERTRREGQRIGAILIDCDNFKRVNDTMGHAVGDVVLQSIANRVRAALRPSDSLGRIGGDEFMVLLPNTRLAEAVQLAERLRVVVADAPLQTKGQMVGITASLGVTLVPEDSLSIEEIVSHTQHALSRSKKAGKNRVSLREGPGTETRTTDDETGDVSRTLEALTDPSSYRTVIQPIFDLVNDRVLAYELLTRGPTGPFEAPDDFFRISIENNILTSVDLLCAKRSVEWVAQHANGVDYHVNLFPSTLLETPIDRMEQLFGVLDDPSRFCVEISEQQFVGDPNYLMQKTKRLREFGVRVALDDVGFGRSSLESLILLEPDIIKIDRSFVSGAHGDSGRQRSLQRLVMLSKNLDTTLVAEGIEEHKDIEVLVDMGVRMGQGYLWGQPSAP